MRHLRTEINKISFVWRNACTKIIRLVASHTELLSSNLEFVSSSTEATSFPPGANRPQRNRTPNTYVMFMLHEDSNYYSQLKLFVIDHKYLTNTQKIYIKLLISIRTIPERWGQTLRPLCKKAKPRIARPLFKS